jgi:hypothetical protein
VRTIAAKRLAFAVTCLFAIILVGGIADAQLPGSTATNDASSAAAGAAAEFGSVELRQRSDIELTM